MEREGNAATMSVSGDFDPARAGWKMRWLPWLVLDEESGKQNYPTDGGILIGEKLLKR